MGTVLQLHELIDLVEDFISDPIQRTIHIGAMTGTQAFKMVIDCVLSKSEFQHICVVEGCQDYHEMTKPSPCNNHLFYADLIKETKIPDFGYSSGFNHGYLVWDPLQIEYKHEVDISYIGRFDYVIINDAHLISEDILGVIKKSYPGKLILIFDPFEAGAEEFGVHPCIIDSLEKSSAITAYARSMLGVSTRAIDRSVRCSVKESKIQRRSIGKNDGSQYVTDSKSLAIEVWGKQASIPFRKGQRLWVTDNRIHRIRETNGRVHTITKNSLLAIASVPVSSKRLKLRLWNSNFVFESEVTYDDKPVIGKICVRPANIILKDEVRYHKYTSTVLVVNNELLPRERYLLAKNTHNLVVGI